MTKDEQWAQVLSKRCKLCGRSTGAAEHFCPAQRDRVEVFTERYVPEPLSGCWLWTGRYQSAGYGFMPMGERDKFILAHRFSWELHRGPIPMGLWVLHRCDVPCCVNPDHLFLGTSTDNNRDCAAKGRKNSSFSKGGVAGSRNVKAKLTEEQVEEIRSLYGPRQRYQDGKTKGVELAKRFGVRPAAIYAIVRREKWGHLP